MTQRQRKQELTPDFLVKAYCLGFFPMAESRRGPIAWYSPDPRAIIPLSEFQPHRSLRRKVQSGAFNITMNTAFENVISACADRDPTWISDEIISAYTRLHQQGVAHSVETWHESSLVGGLYGVAIRGAFFGESMFARVSDASKVALVHLIDHLRNRGFLLLDTQMINPHVKSLGAIEISREHYLAFLEQALAADASFLPQYNTTV